MLFGALQPLEGQIVWKGQGVAIHEPAAARKLGIGMVFQHFSLFDSLTAAENIALSLDRSLPLAEVARRAREVGRTYGLPVDPQAHVGDLSVGSVSASKSYAVSSSNPTSSFSMSRHRC
ncbi:ABC transporter ATP-binding protein [Brucella neotomae]|nr:ABC transporter ATP-binding protein [Brucella neotomae]